MSNKNDTWKSATDNKQPGHWILEYDKKGVMYNPGIINKSSTEFIFIVIKNEIFNVYETNTTFELTMSHKHDSKKEYASIIHNNYIRQSGVENNDLKCVFKNTNVDIDSYSEPTSNNKKHFEVLKEYDLIKTCGEGTKIDLFIYGVENENPIVKSKYTTVGDLYIYNNGILSTQEIIEYNETITRVQLYNSKFTIVNNVGNSALNIVHKIRKEIEERIDTIFYINSEKNVDDTIFNALYIKIFPYENNVKLFDELLYYIDCFYWYKSSSTKMDYELVKEIKYHKTKPPNSPFHMHILDFMYLMAFINNKVKNPKTDNINLLAYCDWLVNIWIDTCPNNNILKTKVKPLENIKNIKTYILKPDYQKYIHNGKDMTVTYGNDKNNFYNIFGPFTSIFNINNPNMYSDLFNKIANNSFIIWYGVFDNKYFNNVTKNGDIYYHNNYTICNITYDNITNQSINDDMNTIINYYINNNNPYYIPNTSIINKDCIDEYCNSKIGCFNFKYEDNPVLKSDIFITAFGNNSISNYLNNKEIVFVGNMDNYNKDKKEFININLLKSITYNKDAYIANSYLEKNYSKTDEKRKPYDIFRNNIHVNNNTNQLITKLNEYVKNGGNYFTPNDIEYINNILREIDYHNKQTKVGLLEIMDSISKLGKVNTFCHKYIS